MTLPRSPAARRQPARSRPPSAASAIAVVLVVGGFPSGPTACGQATSRPTANAHAAVATEGDVWVGQRVVVAVEIRAPGFFDSAPAFEMPPAPGLLLAPPSDRPVLGTETAGDTTFTVQRHEVTVLPRRGGQVQVPPLTIRVSYKRNPLDASAVAETLRTSPVRLSVKVPPGAEKLGGVLSARDLTATESLEPDPATAHSKSGDAFTRTVAFAASGLPSMAFPPFPAAPVDGLGQALPDRGRLTSH